MLRLVAAVAAVLAACGPGGPSVDVSPAVSSVAEPSHETAEPTTKPTAHSPMTARAAHLSMPVELAVDAEGSIYVGQCTFTPGQSVIDRIDRQGMLDVIAGTGELGFGADGSPAGETALDCPAGLTFGPDGLLYFADHGNNRIRRIELDGTISTVAGTGPAGVNLGSFSGDGGPAVNATLKEPWGIAFDSKGNLYIADRDNDRVRRVDLEGVITTVVGTGERGYGGDGRSAVKAQLCGPQGLAVDRADNLYIADDCNDRVRRVGPNGAIATVAGNGAVAAGGGAVGDGGPATAAQLDGPDGLAFGPDGALYIATNPGLRIRRVASNRTITTVAGNGAPGAPADGGRAVDASFPELYGVAFDTAGNLYVADGNGAIYRISTDGRVERFAGAA